MAWTYDVSKLNGDSNSTLYQLRLLIGDVKASDKQFEDEELVWFRSQRQSIYGAAAMACRALSSKLSREVDTVDKDIRTTLSARARSYSRMADDYEAKASTVGPMPYAGGIRYSDKSRKVDDTDRVRPAYNIGMQENFIPITPADNETDT